MPSPSRPARASGPRPTTRPSAALVLRLLALLLLGALTLAGCGGSDSSGSSGQSPAQALAKAKKAFDATSGVGVTLKAGKLPSSVDGLLAADGVGTHQPGFDGSIKVLQSGLSATVPVIAVDDKVYVKFGLWQAIDPSRYNAPDPAKLMETRGGFSSLLTAATGVKKGEQKRDGKDVVTTYAAKVPGDAIATVIPTASAKDSFDAVFTLDDSGRMTRVVLRGPFYPDAADVTYTLGFTDYGTKKTIKAP